MNATAQPLGRPPGRLAPDGVAWLFLFLALVTIGLWSAAAWRDYRETLSDAGRVAADLARLVEQNARGTFGLVDQVLLRVGREMDHRGGLSVVDGVGADGVRVGGAGAYLDEIAASVPAVAGLWIFDGRGRPVLWSAPLLGPARATAMDAAALGREILAGQGDSDPPLRFGPLLWNEPLQGFFFSVSRRLADESGRLAALVVALIPAEHFTRFYDGLDIDRDTVTALYRTDGALLVRHPMPPSLRAAGAGLRDAGFRRLLDGTERQAVATLRSPTDGRKRITALIRVDSLPVVVTVGRAEEAVLADWRHRQWRNGAVAGFVLLALAGLAALASFSLKREAAQWSALEAANQGLAQANHSLRRALADKEVLLREVHHRVKNNLQVVCSLLGLQAHRFTDPEIRAAFRDSLDRVRSMALVHETICQGGAPAALDMGGYLARLAQGLVESYGGTRRGVRLEVTADSEPLDLNTAVPVGLIANEVLTNALKHAFPLSADRAPCLTVALSRQQGRWRLLIRDNGRGFTSSGASSGIGLQIIRSLARQIEGEIGFRHQDGTEFRLDFPGPPAPPDAPDAPEKIFA